MRRKGSPLQQKHAQWVFTYPTPNTFHERGRDLRFIPEVDATLQEGKGVGPRAPICACLRVKSLFCFVHPFPSWEVLQMS